MLVPPAFVADAPLPRPAVDPTTRQALEAAVAPYFQARNTGDPAFLKKAFHPGALMYRVSPQGGMTPLNQAEWQARMAEAKKPAPDAIQRFEWVDAAGDVALVKARVGTETAGFYDFLQLARVNGSWTIVGKSFRRFDAPIQDDPKVVAQERAAIEALLRTKLLALDTMDPAPAQSTFHPRARLNQVVEGQLVVNSPAEWLGGMADAKAAGTKPRTPLPERRIAYIDVEGNAAVGRMEHRLADGRLGVDLVALLKLQEGWRVVGWVFSGFPAPAAKP